jgi:hypothetical protein
MITTVITDIEYNNILSGVAGSHNTINMTLCWMVMTYILKQK